MFLFVGNIPKIDNTESKTLSFKQMMSIHEKLTVCGNLSINSQT